MNLKICGQCVQKAIDSVELWRQHVYEKSRIRETKHLSTDADSSTNAIGGWTKNTQKPDFLKNGKKSPKRKNSETSRNMTKLAIRPSTRGLLFIGKRGFHHVLLDKEYPKPDFFIFTEKIIQNAKTQKHLTICQN